MVRGLNWTLGSSSTRKPAAATLPARILHQPASDSSSTTGPGRAFVPLAANGRGLLFDDKRLYLVSMQTHTTGMKAHIFAACRQLLRPVARLLLKAGVNWKEFSDLSRTVFVEVATREFGLRGRPTNATRVAMLTGINRHEVRRQREALEAADPAPTYMNAAQRVLSGWHQDPDYLGDGGRPRRLADSGPAPSFQDLCRRYGGDMPPTALLRELRRVGAVDEGDDGLLSARARTYIQARVDPEKILRAGSVLEDVGDTVVFDLTAPATARLRFERRAENSSIDRRHVAAFQDFLEQEGMAFLERVDEWLTRHESLAADKGGRARVRLGVGVYHIENQPLQGTG